MKISTILVLVSAGSFLFFGVYSFFLTSEFKRYGLAKFQKLTGCLQLLGAIGLLVGLKVDLILSISALGLTLLMLLGFIVRLKVKDGVLLSLPSFLFMILNLYIFIQSI